MAVDVATARVDAGRHCAAILSSAVTCVRLLAATGSSTTELLAAAAAAFAGYSLADLSTGVYHWFIDNYGGTATPVIGAQVASFMDHHRHPSAITRLEPCNLLHVLAAAVAVALPAAGAALSARGATAASHAFACAFAACAMLSVQFHAWAHAESPARLPAGVGALQAAGALVSRAKHAGHHRPRAAQLQLLQRQRHVEPGAGQVHGVPQAREGDLPRHRCPPTVVGSSRRR